MRNHRLISVSSLLVLCASVVALSAPLAGAARPGCLVTNASSGARFTTLQAAQDAAASGDTIAVRGMCTGSTLLSKNLTIVGAAGLGRPVLAGGGAGPVVQVPRFQGLVVSIAGLTVTGAAGGAYGGVFNGGSLTLTDVTVSGNSGDSGGGIFNAGTLDLESSSVRGNTSTGDGGGIENGGSLTLNRSIVQGNSGANGGGIMNFGGTASLNASIVAANRAAQTAGGIYNQGGLALNSSVVTLNRAATAGGVYNATCTPGFSFTQTGATHVVANAPDDVVSAPAC